MEKIDLFFVNSVCFPEQAFERGGPGTMKAGVGSATASASSSKHKRTLRLYTSVMGRRAKSEGWSSFILDKMRGPSWRSGSGQAAVADQDYNNDKPPAMIPSPISSAAVDDCSGRNGRETWSYLKMFNAKNAKVHLELKPGSFLIKIAKIEAEKN